MLTTEFTVGRPVWVDVGSNDFAASAGFYRSVFGWEHEPLPPEAGGYGFFKKDGKTVAAMGPSMGAAPSWGLYFMTDDAEAAAAAVRDAGGTVREEPMRVFDMGSLAAFADPSGAGFSVWQPGTVKGLDALGDPGALCWTELSTANRDRDKDFYRSLFGWTYFDYPMPDGDGVYTAASTGGENDTHSGLFQPDGTGADVPGQPSGWTVYFATADCDATAEAISSGGGTLLMKPATMEGAGRIALAADPQGAVFAIMANEPTG
ncbi:VOC family protein [Salininema proteolyticum]|uniref:VOC family protein n=2 Tax=Salininema proteolyticum TaxID=1607685 RepID=A0ABV8U494_9ACTN